MDVTAAPWVDSDTNVTSVVPLTTTVLPGTNILSSKEKEAIAVITFIMVCTLVGNSVLILLLLCKRSRRIKRVNVFLINLAIVDITVALITNTTEILFVAFGDWKLGPVVCKLSVYLQIVTLAAATFLLTAMSIDRYQVIVKPMQSLRKRPRIWFKVSAAWIAAFVFALPQLFIFVQVEKGVKYDGNPKRLCLSKGYTHEWQRKVYFTFMTTYILLIPATVMLYCYSKIIAVVWSRAARDQCQNTRTYSLYGKANTSVQSCPNGGLQEMPRVSIRRSLVTASKRRAIVMTLTVIIGFLVCLTPYFLITLVRIYSNYKLQLKQALTVSENIFMTHSALNPLLYGLFTLRPKQIKRLFRCRRCYKRKSRKSTEKNRLINGVGGIVRHSKAKAHFQTLTMPNVHPTPKEANDLVTENTHALVLLNRDSCATNTNDGSGKLLDTKKPLCSDLRGKRDNRKSWLPNRKLDNSECLSMV